MTDGVAPAAPAGVQSWAASRLSTGLDHSQPEWVAQEVPVALVFNGISHAVMMATPADLHDFALGFSLTEGLLDSPAELYGVDQQDLANGIELQLQVSSACEWRLKERRRTLAGRTGCGLCGTDSLSQVRRSLNPVRACQVPAQALIHAESQLRQWQQRQQLTGATHAAAWVDLAGQIQCVREDVGRHNALDKLIGHLLRQHTPPETGFLLITSRASFEMVQKAVAFGAGVLAAVSAPTALAIEVAQAHNLVLAGCVRGQDLVAYSFAERLSAAEQEPLCPKE